MDPSATTKRAIAEELQRRVFLCAGALISSERLVMMSNQARSAGRHSESDFLAMGADAARSVTEQEREKMMRLGSALTTLDDPDPRIVRAIRDRLDRIMGKGK